MTENALFLSPMQRVLLATCLAEALLLALERAMRENGLFERIGRMVSEEVILELIKTKCLPILLCGLEVSPLSKTNLNRSLDFPINRFFMKLFNTSDMQIVTECQSIFNFSLQIA